MDVEALHLNSRMKESEASSVIGKISVSPSPKTRRQISQCLGGELSHSWRLYLLKVISNFRSVVDKGNL